MLYVLGSTNSGQSPQGQLNRCTDFVLVLQMCVISAQRGHLVLQIDDGVLQLIRLLLFHSRLRGRVWGEQLNLTHE